MSYSKWGAMDIQCIYPKASKSIIDAIDRLLATHYGSTKEELDFIIQLRHQVPRGRLCQVNGAEARFSRKRMEFCNCSTGCPGLGNLDTEVGN